MTRILLALALAATILHPADALRAQHVVFMIGEDEYHTWETLPEFARKELEPRGYRVTIVNADTADKNNFPGLIEALRTADLLVLSVRRRTPPAEQLDAVRALSCGGQTPARDSHRMPRVCAAANRSAGRARRSRPGRTSIRRCSAGTTPTTTMPGLQPSWRSRHAQGSIRSSKGISVERLTGAGSLYKVSPLENGTTPLLMGAIPGATPEPVAWTHMYGSKQARVFYTSLGHPDDFKNAEFRRLLVNGVEWAIGK